MSNSFHWADITADKIIREKGDKDIYVCASGITPSGTVHIGNFREIISVALVVQALREKGKKVRFIYSWDDYDVFRKVPKNMPKQEILSTYLRMPITLVPDVYDKYGSYAEYHEKTLENILPTVGVIPDYIYQAKNYRDGKYATEMKLALEKREAHRKCLDEYRTEPLPEDWMPVSVFCEKCLKDTTKVNSFDGEWSIKYSCSSCGNSETIDLRKTSSAKLPWRLDWPMRWAVEKVDFEPAGKDHHSEGGSFDTAKNTVKLFNGEPPVTFQYDFISIKGRGGKISSSGGDVIDLNDVLEIYTPEIARFLFVSTRPNSEFSISFDLDVLKIYEDYESCERLYFSDSNSANAKAEKNNRIYELSQVKNVPKELPYQIPFRHLCNLLQIHSLDIDSVIKTLPDLKTNQIERLKVKAQCAVNWITKFAPEEFKFSINKIAPELSLTDSMKNCLASFKKLVIDEFNILDEKNFGEKAYSILKENNIESSDFFTIIYQLLISKDKGPRLIPFLFTIGKDKILEVLKNF